MLSARLLKPLDYLRIKVVEKPRYDFIYPLIIGTSITAFLFFYPLPINIFGPNGLLSLIVNILQILTGFYIASLAAVATFNKGDMDEHMKGETATLTVIKRGVKLPEKLTRRRFLCLMFGYLAFISILLYFTGGLANLFSGSIVQLIPPLLKQAAKWSFTWTYLVVTSNLIVTTLLGLFYMCDRIHRE